jgi:hypothetical protein
MTLGKIRLWTPLLIAGAIPSLGWSQEAPADATSLTPPTVIEAAPGTPSVDPAQPAAPVVVRSVRTRLLSTETGSPPPASGQPEVVLGLRNGRLVTTVVKSEDGTSAASTNPAYWIGIIAPEPPPESLRNQLGLADNVGLLVLEIAPDSPAAKAGLERFDVLVEAKAGDEVFPIQTIQSLMTAIEKSGEQPFAVSLFRRGKKETVSVQPVRREIAAQLRADQLHFHGNGQGLTVIGPLVAPYLGVPVAMPGVHHLAPSLPDGWTVTVTQQGSADPQVEVRQGDQTWKADLKTVNDLPAVVRPTVLRILSSLTHPHPTTFFVRAPQAPVAGPGPAHMPGVGNPPALIYHYQNPIPTPGAAAQPPTTTYSTPAAPHYGFPHSIATPKDDVREAIEGLRKDIEAQAKQLESTQALIEELRQLRMALEVKKE